MPIRPPNEGLKGRLDRPLQVGRVPDALSNIGQQFLNSPQFETSLGGELFSGSLVIKVETMNPIRSFKARGAQNLVAQLPAPCPLAGC